MQRGPNLYSGPAVPEEKKCKCWKKRGEDWILAIKAEILMWSFKR